jgi:hypothetical protein
MHSFMFSRKKILVVELDGLPEEESTGNPNSTTGFLSKQVRKQFIEPGDGSLKRNEVA